MLKRNKEPWTKPFSEKVSKRIQRIPSQELEMWAENCVNEIGKCLSAFMRTRDSYYLEEALNGAEALHAVVDTLKVRDTLIRK